MANQTTLDEGIPELLSKSSWTAFVVPTLLYGFTLLVLGSILWNLGAMKMFTVFTLVVGGLWLLKLLSLNSRELYADDLGIWLQRGIFPWDKGVVGVKWRDLDEALYSQGFISWLAKSHTVFVQHRFTKANELILPNMDHGDRAAMRINELHSDQIAKPLPDALERQSLA